MKHVVQEQSQIMTSNDDNKMRSNDGNDAEQWWAVMTSNDDEHEQTRELRTDTSQAK